MLDVYSVMFTKAADGIRLAGAFGDPEQWQFDWDRPYTATSGWSRCLPSAVTARCRQPSSRR